MIQPLNKSIPLFAYGEFENVRLTPAHLAKLQQRWGEPLATQRIEHFSRQKEAHGYKYKSDYAALLAWFPEAESAEPVDDHQAFVHEHAVNLQRDMLRTQQQWDQDLMQHQHGERCQDGSVCAYVWSKRPVVPTLDMLVPKIEKLVQQGAFDRPRRR